MGSFESTDWSGQSEKEFASHQQERRKELWGLLGELPWQYKPGPAKLVSTERYEGYTLERLVLDLNGVEPVPALLLIPEKRQKPAPGLLFIHWHGGMYELGKEQIIWRAVRKRIPGGSVLSVCRWGRPKPGGSRRLTHA